MANYVNEALENADLKKFQTRTEDEYLTLEERREFSNDKEANVFISIHTNASGNSDADYIGVYSRKNPNRKTTELVEALVSSLSASNLETSSKVKSIFTNSRMSVLKVNADAKVLIEIGFITNKRKQCKMILT